MHPTAPSTPTEPSVQRAAAPHGAAGRTRRPATRCPLASAFARARHEGSGVSPPGPSPSPGRAIYIVGAGDGDDDAERHEADDLVRIPRSAAIDDSTLSTEQRRVQAERLLNASSIRGTLGEHSLLLAGDQLRSWVTRMWPDARWHREYPLDAVVAGPEGARRIRGTVDLLLETDDGLVLIDHKTFPGPSEQWADKAITYLPQMRAYARVLALAGRRVVGSWIHFPIGGGAVRVG